MAQLEEIA
jgi:dynein heavy chain, axonemal